MILGIAIFLGNTRLLTSPRYLEKKFCALLIRQVRRAPARQRTFAASNADYQVADGHLCGPQGRLAPIASMRRALPHDLTNGLAAAALTLEPGLATPDAVATALATFTGPRHRIASRNPVIYDGPRQQLCRGAPAMCCGVRRFSLYCTLELLDCRG